MLESSSKKYGRMNRIVAVGSGHPPPTHRGEGSAVVASMHSLFLRKSYSVRTNDKTYKL
jgi:hypothetical protein